MKEKFTRSDLQPVVDAMLIRVLKDHGVQVGALDPVHGRRAVRAMLRSAAKIARKFGSDPRPFIALAAACFDDERAVTSRAEA